MSDLSKKPGIMRRLKGAMLKRMHGMITCREFEDFILSYLDDALPEKQRRTFTRHMRFCRECRDYLAAYQRTIALGKAVFDEAEATLPADVPEDLVQAVLESRLE